jgi:hypothetical protein
VRACTAALHGLYHDVDVKCAHPTLLWQVLASEGLKFEQCKLYAEQSATILQLLMKATQLSKVDCKALLYKMLYGGRTETWLKEHNLTEDVDVVCFCVRKSVGWIFFVCKSVGPGQTVRKKASSRLTVYDTRVQQLYGCSCSTRSSSTYIQPLGIPTVAYSSSSKPQKTT